MLEYKLISPRATGVPMAGDIDKPFHVRVENGFNELGKQGWRFCGVACECLVFVREVMEYRNDE